MQQGRLTMTPQSEAYIILYLLIAAAVITLMVWTWIAIEARKEERTRRNEQR